MAGTVPFRHRVTLHALAGLFVGAVWGVWTLASRAPERSFTVHTATPPAVPTCPTGYTAADGFNPSTIAEGTNARWLVRCDPRSSAAAISESIELLWSNELHLDSRAHGEILTGFLRSMARSSNLLLEPIPTSEVVTLGGVPSRTVEVQAALRLPTLFVRAWILPIGTNTLLVTLLGPRDREDEAQRRAETAIEQVRGLRAWETTTAQTPRGWHVEAQCPEGYSDATPANGGSGASAWVGRYCLSPGREGGTELTFAEFPARADSEQATRNLLELATTSLRATGLDLDVARVNAGIETFRTQGLEARRTRVVVDPPPAQVRMRAWMAPAENGTAWALALSMHDHNTAARNTAEQWIPTTRVFRPYAQELLAQRKKARLFSFILLPAFLTAIFGVLVALGREQLAKQDD